MQLSPCSWGFGGHFEPADPGQSPGWGLGASPLKLLQLTLAKNTPSWSIYTELQFYEFCWLKS